MYNYNKHKKKMQYCCQLRNAGLGRKISRRSSPEGSRNLKNAKNKFETNAEPGLVQGREIERGSMQRVSFLFFPKTVQGGERWQWRWGWPQKREPPIGEE